MEVQALSMHSLRMAYGKNPRDDAMIDAYLNRSREASIARRPPEYVIAPVGAR